MVQVHAQGAEMVNATGRRWRVPVPTQVPDHVNHVVTQGTWAYFALSDGSVYGIDLGGGDVGQALRSLS